MNALLLAWLRTHWVSVLLVVLLGYSAIALYGRGSRIGYDRGVAEWKGKYDQKAADLAEAQAKFEKEQRAEETRRQDAIDQVRRDAQKQVQQASADARDADAASKRLQQQADRLAAAYRNASKNPGTPTGGQAAACPAGVLADLLRESDARSGILAAEADRARAAGNTCERSYDSLNNR